MSLRFNFWLNLFFTILNLYFFSVSGSIINLSCGIFCGYCTYRMRQHA